MSNGSYVLNIQKFNDRADSNTNSIPVPCGTVCRHINPCRRSRASSATSTTTMCEISPYVIINSIVGNRSRLIPSPQSSSSTNRISSNGFGIGIGEGITVGSGVAVRVAVTVGDGVRVAVGSGDFVAVIVAELAAVGVTSLCPYPDVERKASCIGVAVNFAVAIGRAVVEGVAVTDATLGVGETVAVAVATAIAISRVGNEVGDGLTIVGEDGDVTINVGVGVLRSVTHPATTVATTIPETTATAKPDNPDVTPASNRRTCSLPLLPSPATSTEA